MDIQWYPGHMAKAERLMREEAKKADIIFLVGDARAVEQSINRNFAASVKNRRIAYIFNKSDLCDEKVLRAWKSYYSGSETPVFFTDCLKRTGLDDITEYMRGLKATFRFDHELRAVIAGIPNVGKSMLINSLSGRASAKTGNIPGVTRGNNWIKVRDEFYLLDTPGVLPPKISDPEDGMVLASTGNVKDVAFDREELALWQIKYFAENYPELISSRYKIDIDEKTPIEIYEAIANKRGFLMKGGVYDYERTAGIITDEVKNGVIGRYSFSFPQGYEH